MGREGSKVWSSIASFVARSRFAAGSILVIEVSASRSEAGLLWVEVDITCKIFEKISILRCKTVEVRGVDFKLVGVHFSR